MTKRVNNKMILDTRLKDCGFRIADCGTECDFSAAICENLNPDTRRINV